LKAQIAGDRLDQGLLEQMGLTEQALHQRQAALNFSREDAALLAQCGKLLGEDIPVVAEELLTALSSHAEIDMIIGEPALLERLLGAMTSYLRELLGGDYHLGYALRRLRIGLVHKGSNVGPRHFLTAVATLRRLLRARLAARLPEPGERAKALAAVEKILDFDLGLVLEAHILSLRAEVMSVRQEADARAADLESAVRERTRQLEELSRRDGLTGLFNQRVFYELLRHELVVANRSAHPVSLVYFDIDRFKELNDRCGHLYGDSILRAVGEAAREVLREVDSPCRYGGDEFSIILPGSTAQNARKVCERLIKAVQRRCPEVALSVGVAQTGPDEFVDVYTLVRMADALMYRAKRQVGNHVCTQVAQAGRGLTRRLASAEGMEAKEG
jgi:diguanylate cyclase (GGDEF)-like protein